MDFKFTTPRVNKTASELLKKCISSLSTDGRLLTPIDFSLYAKLTRYANMETESVNTQKRNYVWISGEIGLFPQTWV